METPLPTPTQDGISTDRPPAPPSHYMEAILDQNQLSLQARAVLELAWSERSQNDGEGTHHDIPSTDAPRLSLDHWIENEAYESFWEDGAMLPMETLDTVSERARSNPELFTRRMVRDMAAFITPINERFYHCLATDYQKSEAEAIIELDDFLSTVMEVSAGDNPEMHDHAVLLKEQLGYLDEESFDFGIDTIAEMWVQYLQKNPEANINLFRRQSNGVNKSFEYVLEKVKGRVFDKDMSARLRIFDTPDTWRDTPGSKLVVLDDWVISGKSVSRLTSQALKEAQAQGYRIDGQIEVHTLSREASAEVSPGVVYRSVFMHDSRDYEKVSMIGSHSSVNYGFEYPMREMMKYLQSRGKFVSSPLLMALEPTMYRDKRVREVIDADYDDILMRDIAEENGVVIEALNKICELESEAYDRAKSRNTKTAHLRKVVNGNSAPASSIEDEELRSIVERIVQARVGLRDVSEERRALRESLGYPKDKI